MIGRRVARGGRPGLIGTAARTAVVAGTATAVSGRVAARQQQRAAPQQAAAEPPAAYPEQQPSATTQRAEPGQSDFDQLERLVELRRQGMLSEDEFAAAKRRLLGM